MKQILLLLLCLSLASALNSCKKSQITMVEISQIVKLEASTVNVNYDSLFACSKMIVNKDKLVLFQNLGKNMFSIFKLPNLEYLYSYGNKGGALKEFASTISPGSISTFNNKVMVSDAGKIHYLSFDDDSVSHSVTPVDASSGVLQMNNISQLNDSMIICTNQDDATKSEYMLVDIKNNRKTVCAPYPDWNVADMKKQYGNDLFLFSSSIVYHPIYEKLFSFYYNFPCYNTLDEQGNITDRFQIKDTDIENTNGAIFFAEASVQNSCIYVLWANTSKENIGKNPQAFKPKILMINYDGQIMNTFELDKPIIAFTVSETDGKIYGIPIPSNENVTSAIYQFDISQYCPTPKTEIFANTLYTMPIMEGFDIYEKSAKDYIHNNRNRNNFINKDTTLSLCITVNYNPLTSVEQIINSYKFLNDKPCLSQSIHQCHYNNDEITIAKFIHHKYDFTDMSTPIGKEVCFLYLMERDSIIYSLDGLVGSTVEFNKIHSDILYCIGNIKDNSTK